MPPRSSAIPEMEYRLASRPAAGEFAGERAFPPRPPLEYRGGRKEKSGQEEDSRESAGQLDDEHQKYPRLQPPSQPATRIPPKGPAEGLIALTVTSCQDVGDTAWPTHLREVRQEGEERGTGRKES